MVSEACLAVKPTGVTANNLPSTKSAKKRAADYQEKFRTAYESSYPPYVHMIEHSAEMQRRRQSDISDYSGEVVEHYGKQGGEVAMRQTNKKV
jgi:hypothetical protein